LVLTLFDGSGGFGVQHGKPWLKLRHVRWDEVGIEMGDEENQGGKFMDLV
jgi:hypothetical protein